MTVACTVAGSDPSGAVGLQADLKVFHQFGVYGTSVVTAITVQNPHGVRDVRVLDGPLVAAQLDAIIAYQRPIALKTGALGSTDVVSALCDRLDDALRDTLLVVDPVVRSSSGAPLLDDAGLATLRRRLLPRSTLITPNLIEAEVLAGIAVRDVAGMREAATRIIDCGAGAVLIKGGHLDGDPIDVLHDGSSQTELRGERVGPDGAPGTGCALSAAITACLASGIDLAGAVTRAKRYLHAALVGRRGGAGPVSSVDALDHWAAID